MSVESCRRRRSSISEQMHRVLYHDRSDKVEPLTNNHGVPSSPDHPQRRQSFNVIRNNDVVPDQRPEPIGDISARTLVAESSRAQLTSLFTTELTVLVIANPTNSIQPLAVGLENDEGQDQTTKDIDQFGNNICASPTWNNNTARKEKRATRHLEAERRELEKRLLHLEEAQARLDSGIYDRNSRRLTKKHPSSMTNGTPRYRTANENSGEGSFRRNHDEPNKTRSRSSSLSSSRSDYDTADEAAPDSPISHPCAVQTRAPDTQSQSPAPGTSMKNGYTVIEHSGLLSPLNGPVNVLRRKPLKLQQKDQVLAKIIFTGSATALITSFPTTLWVAMLLVWAYHE
ncbi:hypothetical protein N7510_010248 [Penicillium lagena]|uniref:uncharacterized protein n=1 Tax=Penicillium lagena TaxID=94218 RepID=UPI002540CCC7|nr:uncharacterized protein N7510_010248 [Penicillium lagena]KAJ5605094.1 hypothetical protein N7510_010248 [Penicillium lagena]